MTEMAKIALLGFGIVGGGVAKLLATNRTIIENRTMQPVAIKHILVRRDFPSSDFKSLMTQSFDDILSDPEITLVVEAMGGVSPAFDYAMSAMEHGKGFITSNKELIAEKGDLLLAMAKKHNVCCLFEAAVGGATPIIRPIRRCLAANRITSLAGVLNGTTNFILTKMHDDSLSYEAALRLAQNLGYAESDPFADVSGLDACRKLAILCSMICGKHVNPSSIETVGIASITPKDIAKAAASGCTIKLLARAQFAENGTLYASVAPTIVPSSHLLAAVRNVHNGLFITTDMAGETLLCGRGAGALPTASAIASDIIEALLSGGSSANCHWSTQRAHVSRLDDETTLI
ncbi:MAG: homoserine dehydrogenase [Angelakisella sp.]